MVNEQKRKVGRPEGRREYVTFEVYVTPEYEKALEDARANAKKIDRSLSRYTCMALAEYNKKVGKR